MYSSVAVNWTGGKKELKFSRLVLSIKRQKEVMTISLIPSLIAGYEYLLCVLLLKFQSVVIGVDWRCETCFETRCDWRFDWR